MSATSAFAPQIEFSQSRTTTAQLLEYAVVAERDRSSLPFRSASNCGMPPWKSVPSRSTVTTEQRPRRWVVRGPLVGISPSGTYRRQSVPGPRCDEIRSVLAPTGTYVTIRVIVALLFVMVLAVAADRE